MGSGNDVTGVREKERGASIIVYTSIYGSSSSSSSSSSRRSQRERNTSPDSRFYFEPRCLLSRSVVVVGSFGGKGGSIHLVTLALAIPAHTHIDDEQSSFYFSPIFFLVQERERGKAISFYRHTHTSLVREGRESRLRLWAAD
jgi:hypothetical protein